MKALLLYIKDKYVNPKYPFQDRLYFLFGTAGVISAGAAFLAAVVSKLPMISAIASLLSFFIMLALISASFFMKNISIARIVCSVFLNFFMFPALFWVTGGANCGMVFYFILALCVATLILDGKTRAVVLVLALTLDVLCLYLGFEHPEWAYSLSYDERKMDTVSSFLIVALFIIAVILIMSMEYQKEHLVVLSNNEQLKQQVMIDTMTTLYNQSFLLTALAAQIEACDRGEQYLSIAMFDIDDFKQVNDSYGHLRGNQVLCQFSAILKEASGQDKIATRYGGEEFLVLLPHSRHAEALSFAEEVRVTVRKDPVLQGLTNSAFAVSGGVAEYQAGMSSNEFIDLVDTRLYLAKQRGKNQIVG